MKKSRTNGSKVFGLNWILVTTAISFSLFSCTTNHYYPDNGLDRLVSAMEKIDERLTRIESDLNGSLQHKSYTNLRKIIKKNLEKGGIVNRDEIHTALFREDDKGYQIKSNDNQWSLLPSQYHGFSSIGQRGAEISTILGEQPDMNDKTVFTVKKLNNMTIWRIPTTGVITDKVLGSHFGGNISKAKYGSLLQYIQDGFTGEFVADSLGVGKYIWMDKEKDCLTGYAITTREKIESAIDRYWRGHSFTLPPGVKTKEELGDWIYKQLGIRDFRMQMPKYKSDGTIDNKSFGISRNLVFVPIITTNTDQI